MGLKLIETSPKGFVGEAVLWDGRRFYIGRQETRGYSRKVFVRQVEDGDVYRWAREETVVWLDEAGNQINATHWMPLPDRPAGLPVETQKDK